MGKRKPTFKMHSFGEYSEWDRKGSDIPKILAFETDIEAKTGTEFGYVLQIKNGKGEKLDFRIDHPPFTNEDGNIRPPFTGEHYIRTNDYTFYIGDCIWEPVEDKLGKWEITTYYKNEVVAHKIFNLK